MRVLRVVSSFLLWGPGCSVQVSSVHLTFNSEEEWKLAASSPGWLSRMGVQFHWENDGYKCAPPQLSNQTRLRRTALLAPPVGCSAAAITSAGIL